MRQIDPRCTRIAPGRLGALLALAVLGLLPSPARADAYLDDHHPHQTFWAGAWEVGIPITQLRSAWVDAPSFQGGQFEVRVGVIGRLSVGAAFNWNWFYQNFPSTTVSGEQITVTGPAYHRLSTMQARGTAHYYLTQTAVQPYVGVGLGVIWVNARNQISTLNTEAKGSYLCGGPEAGILFNLLPKFSLFVAGRYQWTSASFFDVKNAQWVTVQLGVAAYI